MKNLKKVLAIFGLVTVLIIGVGLLFVYNKVQELNPGVCKYVENNFTVLAACNQLEVGFLGRDVDKDAIRAIIKKYDGKIIDKLSDGETDYAWTVSIKNRQKMYELKRALSEKKGLLVIFKMVFEYDLGFGLDLKEEKHSK